MFIKRALQSFFSFCVIASSCEHLFEDISLYLAICKLWVFFLALLFLVDLTRIPHVVLGKIAKENSLNRTGAVNFNKYGQQDGIGFSPCRDKLVDNFLFYVYVPDYFVTAKKTYMEVGHVNKHIRDMLDHYGLHKCKVKAVALSPLKEQLRELDEVYGRLKTKETNETVYYMQEFKVACADKETLSSSYEPTSIR